MYKILIVEDDRIIADTRHEYIKMYDKVENEIGSIKMKDLTITAVQKALNTLPSDPYRKRVRSILHRMFECALDDGMLERNPARKAVWNVTHDPKKRKRHTYIHWKVLAQWTDRESVM